MPAPAALPAPACRFLERHAASALGMLSGWDRLRLRGTLCYIAHAAGLAGLLARAGHALCDFGRVAEDASHRIRDGALAVAAAAGRPVQHLRAPGVCKEDLAREAAARDGVTAGLVCTLTAVEPCWSFALGGGSSATPFLRRAYRKCLFVYHYLIHPAFGLAHVRMQTWLPFNVHVGLNGREWLARQMDAAGVGYVRQDNCFPWVADVAAAQALLDAQRDFAWQPTLAALGRWASPALGEVVAPYAPDYYWSIEQSEWATDVMFRSAADLARLYPALLRHGMATFGSRDVLRFLGQPVPATARGHCFGGDLRQIQTDLKGRPEGVRLKHRLGHNTIKMYDKGPVLRVETTLNDVRQLKVPRRVEGGAADGAAAGGGAKVVWKVMRKGVADARRRADVSEAANRRYLDAMAAVVAPTPLKDLAGPLARPAACGKQRVRGLNLLGEADAALLAAAGRGEFLIHGLRNRDLRAALFPDEPADDPARRRRRCGQVTRRLRMLRAHGLVAKLPRTHRYVVSDKGRLVIAAVAAARDANVAQLTAAA